MTTTVPLDRVVLSTAGLAQLVYKGNVSPGTTLKLSVRSDQVDDVLKSLVVLDKENALGPVMLPGKMPLKELFRDSPLCRENLKSLPALLNALCGAEVEVTGYVNTKGNILHVVEQQSRDESSKRHQIALFTSSGLKQAVLEELNSIRFTEENLQKHLEVLLEGIAKHSAQDRREIAIQVLGESQRDVGFSYVIAAPVWKAAYRLVLPSMNASTEETSDEEVARLQGWAVVENLSGSDWNNVEVSLIAGNPVALKQNLYSSFYVERPEAPVDVARRIVPTKDEGNTYKEALLRKSYLTGSRFYGLAAGGVSAAQFGGSAALYGSESIHEGTESSHGDEVMRLCSAKAPPPTLAAEEFSTQVSFNFQSRISFNSGGTMMLPFVDCSIAAKQTWLYQPETNESHPLAAVLLTNTSTTPLPPGIITGFGATSLKGSIPGEFVGDAQLPFVPTEESRFVTFALDTKTRIKRLQKPIVIRRMGKAANDLLELIETEHMTIEYEITTPATEARKIVIDEQRLDNWNPDPESSVQLTPKRMRITLGEIPKASTYATEVKLQQTRQWSLKISSFQPSRIILELNTIEELPKEVRDQLDLLSQVVGEMNDAKKEQEDLVNERERIKSDQSRLRDNINSVGTSSDLGERYISALRTQEDRLDQIWKRSEALHELQETKRKSASRIASMLKF